MKSIKQVMGFLTKKSLVLNDKLDNVIYKIPSSVKRKLNILANSTFTVGCVSILCLYVAANSGMTPFNVRN